MTKQWKIRLELVTDCSTTDECEFFLPIDALPFIPRTGEIVWIPSSAVRHFERVAKKCTLCRECLHFNENGFSDFEEYMHVKNVRYQIDDKIITIELSK